MSEGLNIGVRVLHSHWESGKTKVKKPKLKVREAASKGPEAIKLKFFSSMIHRL